MNDHQCLDTFILKRHYMLVKWMFLFELSVTVKFYWWWLFSAREAHEHTYVGKWPAHKSGQPETGTVHVLFN